MSLTMQQRLALYTGLRNMGCTPAVVAGQRLLFATGEQGRAGGRPCLLALDASGNVLWRDDFPEEPGAIAMGAEPHVLDLGEGRLAVAHFVAHRASGAQGVFRLLEPLTGVEIWRALSGSIYGGNRDVHCVDIDGDGELEIIAGYADRLVCYQAGDGATKWENRERIAICWGRSAIADLDDDGRLEIVVGTEYANPDATSSLLALRADGSVLWEYAGIEGDCGSRPTYVADFDGDGELEVLHTELDLERRGPLHSARLWCLTADGRLEWSCNTGAGDIAIADFAGDGAHWAIGITSGRDGGGAPPAVRCVDLRTGQMRWQTPLERHWLSGWPVAHDTDGDGVAEAILLQGNPSGYGRMPGTEPWGEMLVVKGDGRIVRRFEYRDWPVSARVFDWDGDGQEEVLVGCGDGCVYVYGR